MKLLASWLPVALWGAAIFLASATPAPPTVGPKIPGADKAVHFAAYFIFGLLTARALTRSSKLSLPKSLLLAIVIAAAYGASDEFHQRFVPNRECDLFDWLADSLGAVAAAGIYYAYESRRSKKTNCPTA
jgi:VanZ family protein